MGSLAYLNKAVELNDYDESALVARSRCHHQLGRHEMRNVLRLNSEHSCRNNEAISDGLQAVELNSRSHEARQALGRALYSDGQLRAKLKQIL